MAAGPSGVCEAVSLPEARGRASGLVTTVVLDRKIHPGKVFDLVLPLDRVAEGYRAMDERRAIKTLLRP